LRKQFLAADVGMLRKRFFFHRPQFGESRRHKNARRETLFSPTARAGDGFSLQGHVARKR
jgi:hypothetical protein